MSKYSVPDESYSAGRILQLTVLAYLKNLPLILVFGSGAYFAFQYFILKPEVISALQTFLEAVKSSIFYNAMNSIGGLLIFTAPIPIKQTLAANWELLLFALIVQPFIFGCVTIIAARKFRSEKSGFTGAVKDTAYSLLKFIKLSFTLLYIGVLLTVILGVVILVVLLVFSAISRTFGMLTAPAIIVASVVFFAGNIFTSIAYPVSLFEGKLAFKTIARCFSLVKEDFRNTLIVVLVITALQLAVMFGIFFSPTLFENRFLIMTVVASVLMPLMFIAPVYLYGSLLAKRNIVHGQTEETPPDINGGLAQ